MSRSNTPSAVYTTDNALQGASLEARVGQLATGTSSVPAIARAVSNALPPPTPITRRAPAAVASATPRSISALVHSPLKSPTVKSIPASPRVAVQVSASIACTRPLATM